MENRQFLSMLANIVEESLNEEIQVNFNQVEEDVDTCETLPIIILQKEIKYLLSLPFPEKWTG